MLSRRYYTNDTATKVPVNFNKTLQPQKFSTTNDLHYTALCTFVANTVVMCLTGPVLVASCELIPLNSIVLTLNVKCCLFVYVE